MIRLLSCYFFYWWCKKDHFQVSIRNINGHCVFKKNSFIRFLFTRRRGVRSGRKSFLQSSDFLNVELRFNRDLLLIPPSFRTSIISSMEHRRAIYFTSFMKWNPFMVAQFTAGLDWPGDWILSSRSIAKVEPFP